VPLSGWAVEEWAIDAGLLVMGDQGLGAFSTGICWFRDFLAINGLCGLTSSRHNTGSLGRVFLCLFV
jgi:hypothetical protein